MEPHDGDADVAQVRVEEWRALLGRQLDQCIGDIRQNDAILWQIPATIGAIVALVLNFLGEKIVSGPIRWLEVVAVVTTLLVTSSLVLTEYKNRVFQVTRNIYRKSIYNELLRVAHLPSGEMVTPALVIRDFHPDSLPGSVEVASRLLDSDVLEAAWKAAGPSFFGAKLARVSAYKTLFYISLAILVGELLLLVSFVVRAL